MAWYMVVGPSGAGYGLVSSKTGAEHWARAIGGQVRLATAEEIAGQITYRPIPMAESAS